MSFHCYPYLKGGMFSDEDILGNESPQPLLHYILYLTERGSAEGARENKAIFSLHHPKGWDPGGEAQPRLLLEL
jgi:hypothetical protein